MRAGRATGKIWSQVELKSERSKTRMLFAEQGVFLDGLADPAEREKGTRLGLGRLDAFLTSDPVAN